MAQLHINLDDDPELLKLMDAWYDAGEAGDMSGYMERLEATNPRQYHKLMSFLCQEIETELRRMRH